MTVHLPEDHKSFVQGEIQSGAYPNEDELLIQAVRRPQCEKLFAEWMLEEQGRKSTRK